MVSTLCRPQLENATKLAFRAYVGGIVTCFITASIAGKQRTILSVSLLNNFTDRDYISGLLMPSNEGMDDFMMSGSSNITSF